MNDSITNIAGIIVMLMFLSFKWAAIIGLPKAYIKGEVDKTGLQYALLISIIYVAMGIFLIFDEKGPIDTILLILYIFFILTGICGVYEYIKAILVTRNNNQTIEKEK